MIVKKLLFVKISQPKNKLGIITLVGGGEDNIYSAEIEQELEQDNECGTLQVCVNAAAQVQLAEITAIGGGEYNKYSAEIEQELEQENKCETALV